ncbi:ASCH domain-containing protein [Clostridium botulinum]|uniref:ASCH domain-containing protein n=1 Tax=Clostridium TaxID=1485 RepID=UPI0005052F8F|nr:MULTISPECIES: ASCH domain-containing protein [unclassified Clostridium]AIY81703.1 ASCH domain protein [Clostridium botulinum 202F]KAI3348436.1 ASCH domain-containing protein [Clostridium botulinum]KFX58117.1 RNA-binding protein [Clostridium botulinum]KFX59008.1 RNA-binding protein [Clostridium botulinum]KON12740.1 RNA-binding protein [Clostridium botulinum]
MSNEHSSINKMWKNYLNLIGENEFTTKLEYNSWSFGDNEALANELVELVLKGEKTATTSLYYLYELETEVLPKEEQLAIITDFSGNAKCIIKTKHVNVLPFSKVKAEFAFKEGEGDKSLEYWKKGHIDFFNRGLKDFNKEFSEDMLVVCEEFEVIYN